MQQKKKKKKFSITKPSCKIVLVAFSLKIILAYGETKEDNTTTT